MRESFIQQFRTVAIYLLIGLPILWLANMVWHSMHAPNFLEQHHPFQNVKLDQKITGKWKFNILDTPAWIEQKLDDEQWEEISVPSSWEKQGFENYNGFAWYRKKVSLNPELKGKSLDLYLGRIDDVDEAYVDGKLIGKSGQFPPQFATSFSTQRLYHIPPQLTEDGEIQLAVRVFDAEFEGGILEGPVGLKLRENQQFMDISLEGIWQFRKSSEGATTLPGENEGWSEIYVPSTWEGNGNYDYDGFAWYKKEFELTEEQAKQDWVAVLGKIDDIDQTFINGQMIGSTGTPEAWGGEVSGEEWQMNRGYFVPEGVLKAGKNVLSVRVLDVVADGGIYKGPIGLVLQENYTAFWKKNHQKKSTSHFYSNPHEKLKGKHMWCQH